MQAKKIIIVDDHQIFREGLKLVLSTIEGVSVVGEAADGREFLKIIRKKPADIIFMDLSMPDIDGMQATEEALKINPKLKIIAISSYDEIDMVNQSLYAGVEGYLLKNADYKEIEQAIINVSEGKTFFSKKILDNITRNSIRKQKERLNKIDLPTLTKRENEILTLICEGDDTFCISAKLFISERTVEKHKQNLMNKTNTHSTAKLIIFALKNNFIKI